MSRVHQVHQLKEWLVTLNFLGNFINSLYWNNNGKGIVVFMTLKYIQVYISFLFLLKNSEFTAIKTAIKDN